jgi:hypothetical protein
MAIARWLTLSLVIAVVCAGCGGGSSRASIHTSTTVGSIAPAPATTAAVTPTTAAATPTTAVTATPAGCGKYCLEAGESAGLVPGYPCPAPPSGDLSGCLNCPPQNCVTVHGTSATAADGVVTMSVSCNLATTCEGAFLLCVVSEFCSGLDMDGGRLGGSDFVVPAGATRDVPVTLTDMGSLAASQIGGYRSTYLVNLLNYGNVIENQFVNPTTCPSSNACSGELLLQSQGSPLIPPGAVSSCPSVGSEPPTSVLTSTPRLSLLYVGPNTSCPFAQNVESTFRQGLHTAYQTSAKSVSVNAYSPTTGQTYEMQCSLGTTGPDQCTGGTGASVIFYLVDSL